MEYLYSFLFVGVICLIGQILFDKSKLTPGHIVSMFVVIGVILSFLGVYDILLKYIPGGASVLITNYGHLLYSSGLNGLSKNNSLLDALMELLANSSSTLSMTIFMGFLCSIVTKHG